MPSRSHRVVLLLRPGESHRFGDASVFRAGENQAQLYDAMRIELNDQAMIDDLRTFLVDCSCKLEVRGNVVYASPPALQHDGKLGRLQLDGFLHAWRALHPEVDLRIDGVGGQAPPLPARASLSRDA